MKKLNVIWLLIVIFFVGCQTEILNENLDLENVANVVYNSSETIRNNGNYLDFAYYDEFEGVKKFKYNQSIGKVFESTKSNLTAIKPIDLANELNFKSLGHKYDELIQIQRDYEISLNHKYSSYSKKELEKLDLDQILRFAPEIYRHLDILNIDENTGQLQLKVVDLQLAYLLNEKGIISIGGALYQYTGDQVKFMPLNGKNKVSDLLNTTTNDDVSGIKVSEISFQNSNTGRNDVVTCQQGATGNNAENGLYISGEITHRTFSTYIYEYVCAYDSNYYVCWYQNTSGLSYNEKIDACCPRQPVLRRVSKVDVRVNSRTSCDFWFIFCFGDGSQSVDELNITGTFGLFRGGAWQNTLFNVSENNTAYLSHNLYDGSELYDGVSVNADFFLFHSLYSSITLSYGCSENYGL